MIHIPLTKKQQEGFLKELPKLPHIQHNFDSDTGVIEVQEKNLKLSYKLVAEIEVVSNPNNIPEKDIKAGLEAGLKVLQGS
jgi:hypothetical protein